MFLVVLEVSQKQNYIFASKHLVNNVARSANIRNVTEEDFLKKAWPQFSNKRNLVYTGGGHTILQFDTREEAEELVRAVTRRAYLDYDGMELFARIMKVQEDKDPGENIICLMKELERKKSLRLSAFRQRGLGLEQDERDERKKGAEIELEDDRIQRSHPTQLSYLCDRDDFYAVVHIDGNNMGKKSQAVTESCKGTWKDCCDKHKKFSEGVDDAFRSALVRTILQVEAWEEYGGPLYEVKCEADEKRKHSKEYRQYPEEQSLDFHLIRPLIAAGDDICFLVPVSIALDCAAAFLNFLQNPEGGLEKYAACAGVAIVHEKYPYHRAYDLSEALCSSAKQYAAALVERQGPASADTISTIDWHIEFGQDKGSVTDIREDYLTEECGSGSSKEDPVSTMTLRPLCVIGEIDNVYRTYASFRKLVEQLRTSGIPRSKLKGMRTVIKQDEETLQLYLRQNQIMKQLPYGTETLSVVKNEAVGEGKHHVRRNLYFDAIELMDKMIRLDTIGKEQDV